MEKEYRGISFSIERVMDRGIGDVFNIQSGSVQPYCLTGFCQFKFIASVDNIENQKFYYSAKLLLKF